MANLLSQNWLLDRRHFLRGLGVSLALPFLDCMRPLRASEDADRPRRSVFIYLPNGVNTNDYEMEKAGRDYELSRILTPLEKHRANITPISGLYHPTAAGIAHSATQTWLTGAKYGPTDRNSISVDQLIAQVSAPKTRYSSLEISNQGQTLAVSAAGVSLPARKSPAVVVRSRVAGRAPPAGPAARGPRPIWEPKGPRRRAAPARPSAPREGILVCVWGGTPQQPYICSFAARMQI